MFYTPWAESRLGVRQLSVRARGRAKEQNLSPPREKSECLALGYAIRVDERCRVLQSLTYIRFGYSMPVGKLLDRRCVETSGLDKVQGFGFCIQKPRDRRNTQ